MQAISSAKFPSGVMVRTTGLHDLPAVTAGERSLALVFNNLFENAVDAMSGQGEITIGGAVSSNWVEILVSDSGPGIPPELHDRIFEFNYSARAKARPGKLGFGLWWAKTVVRRLGGSIQVESDGMNGASFRLRLPRVEG
jgi:signal transduction histidine kinase